MLFRSITLPPTGHWAQFVSELFPESAKAGSFYGSASIHSEHLIEAVSIRMTHETVAAVALDHEGFYRPSITDLTVLNADRTSGSLDFEIHVVDLDLNVAESSNTDVIAVAILDCGDSEYDYGLVHLDGSSMVAEDAGVLRGTFIPRHLETPVASGYDVWLFVYIEDSEGNSSNFMAIPITY